MPTGQIIKKIDECLEKSRVMTKDVTEMASLLYEIRAYLEEQPPVVVGAKEHD